MRQWKIKSDKNVEIIPFSNPHLKLVFIHMNELKEEKRNVFIRSRNERLKLCG